jgi:hypothetical protein
MATENNTLASMSSRTRRLLRFWRETATLPADCNLAKVFRIALRLARLGAQFDGVVSDP